MKRIVAEQRILATLCVTFVVASCAGGEGGDDADDDAGADVVEDVADAAGDDTADVAEDAEIDSAGDAAEDNADEISEDVDDDGDAAGDDAADAAADAGDDDVEADTFDAGGDADTAGTTCGDGVVEGNEECDDGGTDPGDVCTPDCTWDPASLPSAGWSLDVASGDWIGPETIDIIMDDIVDEAPRVLVELDAIALGATVGTGYFDEGALKQNLCSPTTTGAWAVTPGPTVRVLADAVLLTNDTNSVALRDTEIGLHIDVETGAATEASLRGQLDARDVAPLIEQTPADVCALWATALELVCGACGDGEEFCVDIEGEAIPVAAVAFPLAEVGAPDPDADLRMCAGACVDIITDEQHCGGCGESCADGSSCFGRECFAP